jgi:predicted metal-dependent peptidase
MKINPIELNVEQKRKWIETRSKLLWDAPAFTHILYSMLNPDGNEMSAVFSTDIPIAATDGSAMILNPETYFKLPLQQRVFVAAHEIMHCVFNHTGLMRTMTLTGKVKYPDGSELPYDPMMMNMAMDFVINDLLIETKVGEFVPEGCHDKNIATSETPFIDAYAKIYKKHQSSGGGGNGPKSFDVLLDPGTSQGKDPSKAQQDRSQTEWDTAIAAAVASAKMQGKLPSALERLFKEVLEPTVSWQDHIRSFFARKVGAGGYDWRKPDRRMISRDIYSPARSGNGCGDVVVAVDTSGSIGQRELDHFFAELRGILEDVQPSRVHLVWCDAKVHHVDELDSASDLQGLKPHGGGGTAFEPVFAWIGDQPFTPDALVYLTDGMGSFPKSAPTYPVVWGDIYGHVKYPFGDVVHIPINKK